MTTIAAIAAAALDAVALEITDAVAEATVTRKTRGTFDAPNGVWLETEATETGRAVFCDMGAAADMFPANIIGPADELLLLEGFTGVQETDVVAIGARSLTVMAVQDIGGAGTLFYAVAR